MKQIKITASNLTSISYNKERINEIINTLVSSYGVPSEEDEETLDSILKHYNAEVDNNNYECKKNWVLNNIKRPETPHEAQLGINFENDIQTLCEKNSDDEEYKNVVKDEYYNNKLKIAEKLKGGKFQQNVQSSLFFDDIEWVLKGKIDILFPSYIVDLKTTKSFFEYKYKCSIQHVIYMEITNINHFCYMVQAWDEPDTIHECYIERNDNDTDRIVKKIKDVRDILINYGLDFYGNGFRNI